MTNRERMKKYVLSNVVPMLLGNGFTGMYPHYRKIDGNCIELITFQTNKWGGSFTVEVSAIFPHAKDSNCAHDTIEAEKVTVWDTNNRYRLKGMYDGWFHYNDLYAKRIFGFVKDYLAVSEKQKEDFAVPIGYKLVQEFNEETAINICNEVNIQLKEAYKWLENVKMAHK